MSFSKLFGFSCKGLQLVLESLESRDVKRCQEASNLDQLRLSRCLCLAAFTFYARLCATHCVLACICGCAHELWHQQMTPLKWLQFIDSLSQARTEQGMGSWGLTTFLGRRTSKGISSFWHILTSDIGKAVFHGNDASHMPPQLEDPLAAEPWFGSAAETICFAHVWYFLIIFAYSSSIFLGRIRNFCIKRPWTETSWSGCEDDPNKLPADEIVVSKDPEERKRKLKDLLDWHWLWEEMRRVKKYLRSFKKRKTWKNDGKTGSIQLLRMYAMSCVSAAKAGDTNWMCPASGLSSQRWMHRLTHKVPQVQIGNKHQQTMINLLTCIYVAGSGQYAWKCACCWMLLWSNLEMEDQTILGNTKLPATRSTFREVRMLTCQVAAVNLYTVDHIVKVL